MPLDIVREVVRLFRRMTAFPDRLFGSLLVIPAYSLDCYTRAVEAWPLFDIGWGELPVNGQGFAAMGESATMGTLDRLWHQGLRSILLTFHGNRQHHDSFVRRPGAYDTLLTIARWVSKSPVRLMPPNYFVSRDNVDMAAEVLADLTSVIAPRETSLFFRIAEYVPNPRLRHLEALRVAADEWARLLARFPDSGHTAFWQEGDVVAGFLCGRRAGVLDPCDYRRAQKVVLHCERNLDIWEGEIFEECYVHGNLERDGLAAVGQSIRDYDRQIPGIRELAEQFGDPGSNRLHPDTQTILCKLIDLSFRGHRAGQETRLYS